MPTVIITGATGFLGRFLTTHLANIGLTIVPVSRRPSPGMCQVQDYSQSPDGDILIHFAEESDRGKVNQIGEAYVSYASGVIKVLSHRYPKVIYASSGSVYGCENEVPCRVDMPVVTTDTYSRAKLLNEKIVLDAGGVVARLSNLFGYGMSPNNVISDIIRQVSEVGPLRVRDEKPVRDFLHVSDAAFAFGCLIENGYCGIVNVGSGIGMSIKDLARLVLALVGQQERDVLATQPSLERSINVLDISETIKLIDWSPKTSLKEGLVQLLF